MSQHNINAELDLSKNPELAALFTSQFGFKNGDEILNFINSPAGFELRSAMLEALEEVAEIEEYQQVLAEEETRVHHLKLLLFFLGLLHRRNAHASHHQEQLRILQEQLKHQLEAHEKAKKQASNETELDEDSSNAPTHAFNQAHEALENQYHEKQNALSAVEKNIDLLQQEKIELEKESALFNQHLTDLDQTLNTANQADDPKQLIEDRINALKNTMDAELQHIDTHVAEGRDQDAISLLQVHQGHHLELQGLHDMLDVLNGEKHLTDEHGNTVHTLNKAHFVLDKKQQIVKDHDGRCYLIPAHENLESIKQSANAHERLHQAHQQYQKQSADNTSVHALVNQHQSVKEADYAKRLSLVMKQSQQLQQDMGVLSSQLNQLNASQNQLNMVQAQQLITVRPQAKPNQSITMMSPPKPSPVLSARAIQQKQLDIANPTPTPSPKPGKTTSNATVQQLLAEKLMQYRLASKEKDPFKAKNLGKIFNAQELRLLLEGLDRQGLAHQKRSMTPSTTTAPTPFSMTPNKIKPY